MMWFHAYPVAYEAALSMEPDKHEREEWALVLSETSTVWMRAYERNPTGRGGPPGGGWHDGREMGRITACASGASIEIAALDDAVGWLATCVL